MKKIILFGLGFIVLAFIAIFGYAAINANSLIATYKPELEKMASKAMGTKLALGEIGVSFFPSLKIHIQEISLAEKPNAEDFQLKNLDLNLSLKDLLFGKLTLTTLSIDQPIVTLLKVGDKYKIAGLPEAKEKIETSASEVIASTTNVDSPKTEQTKDLPVTIKLESLSINKAQIKLIDQKQQYDLATVSIKTGISIEDGKLQISGLTVNSEEISPPGSEIKIKNLNLSGSITGDIKSKSFIVDLSPVNFGINAAPLSLTAHVELKENTVNVNAIHLNGFSGSVDLLANLNSNNGNLSLETNGTGLDIETILIALKPSIPAAFSGKISTFSLKVDGNTKTNLPNSLQGKGSLSISEGKMIGSNLAGDVLSAISNLPFLSGSLFSQVSESDQEKLKSKETEIKTLSANFTINKGSLTTNDFVLASSIFSLSAQGSVGFDANLNLKCQMSFNQLFSSAIVSKVKELQSALDENGQLVIPVTLTGKAPMIIVAPDVSALLKIGLKGAATKALTDLLQGNKSGKGLGGLLGF
ncbi:MAG: AsmA-like C-terminal region-containing protein [bacterium]|nr:AsmA-like C-terminal region-containing protein [bacterium]